MVAGLKIKETRLFGHQAGARRVREIVESCPDLGIKYLTIFAFSTENWKRTQLEVSGLMKLFKRYIYRNTTTNKSRCPCSIYRRSGTFRAGFSETDGPIGTAYRK